MRFAILGPLEVLTDDGQRLPLGGPQQRALLAVLLLNAGRVVSIDRLVECLWGERPPANARSLVQGCVAGLRRVFKTAPDSDRQPMVTRAPGYFLELRPEELDLDRFEQLVDAAGRSARSSASSRSAQRSAWERSASLFTEALALWRGPPLDGIDLDACRADVARLEERRLTVIEQRIDIDLQLGRYAEVVGELESLIHAHALRERLWAQLMLALYGSDRRADALASYQKLRHGLVEHLGVEPSATVRRLQMAVLSGVDPGELCRPEGSDDAHEGVPTSAPAQLPPAVADFTGRDDVLEQLDAMVPDGAGSAALSVISGTAGVGKTALAVHWAHRVRRSFGDGQLYVNLRGYAHAPPMPPAEALAGFLHALGLPPEAVPDEAERATALYRTLLADKRMLILLDNAHSAEQVRPLLPGSPGCLVLVTSRDRLAGVVARDGARHFTLDVLAHHEAVDLLAKVVGRQRVEAEPARSADLVEACNRLPLALRIAAANLACHPGRRIADGVSDLAASDRLGALAIEGDPESAVRVAFDQSYKSLSEQDRLLFRRLGLVPGPHVTAPAAAALVDAENPDATRRLERLTSTHLVYRDDDHFALHDLLRLYASERTEAEDSPQTREDSLARLLDWYLQTADSAARQLYPAALRLEIPDSATPKEDFSGQSALRWLDSELPNLVAAIRLAAERGPRPMAWLLADALRGYFMLRVLPVEWATVAGAAWSAALADDEPRAQVAAQLNLAGLYHRRGRFDEAIDHYEQALAINERAGWPEGESAALGNLGTVYYFSGHPRIAADHFRRALEVDRRVGWLGGQAVKLGNLAIACSHMGRLDEAAAHLTEAKAMFGELGARHGEATALSGLGGVERERGRYAEALTHLNKALELHRELGDRHSEAVTNQSIAVVHRDTGRLTTALELATLALQQAIDVGERVFESETQIVLGSIHMRLGAAAEAEGHYRRALEVAATVASEHPRVGALIGLAGARRALGDPGQAHSAAEQALSLARARDFRLLEGQALVALAEALTDLGRPAAAADHAKLALEIQRATGHRLGAARALLALAGTSAGSPSGAGPAAGGRSDSRNDQSHLVNVGNRVRIVRGRS